MHGFVIVHMQVCPAACITVTADNCSTGDVGELLAAARAAMDLPALAPSDAVLMSDTSMQVRLHGSTADCFSCRCKVQHVSAGCSLLST
jgi:hypothetical protein